MDADKIIVGKYSKHSEAVDAVGNIQEMGLDVSKHVSIIGIGALVENQLEIRPATNALVSSVFFGILVGAIAGGIAAYTSSETVSNVEAFLTAMSISTLAGAALGFIRAVIIGPKGKLHLHKHWQLDEYQVVLEGVEVEVAEKIKTHLGA